ncbi:MAG TPA: trypsin-like serine protease [Myxococcota bacterium]|nr:trypsin-like serine protease [Myxococcota bacterium]
MVTQARIGRSSVWTGLLLLALGTACSDERVPSDYGTQGRPIFYGTTDNVASHTAVVAITNGSGTGYYCSGTLIAPDVVLTAAHCLQGETAAGTDIFFGANAYQPAGGQYRSVSDLEPHPQYDGWLNDIALIRMSSAAPAGIAPILALPEALGLTSADNNTTTVDFSGFGLTENDTDGVKLHVDGTIALVCAGPADCTYSGNDVVAMSFAYSQAGSIGGPCSGDSGGPAFVVRDGVEYVAGVTSYGDQQCTDYGVSTTVSAFEAFIADYLDEENCTNGVDDDGDGAVDCDDSGCASHWTCVPNACNAAVTVGCGSSLSSTTSGGSDVFTSFSCDNQSTWTGPERAYFIDVPVGARVTVTMDPTTGQNDLDLFLLGGACDPDACLDVSAGSQSSAEQIVFTMPAGGAYAVVETWDNTSNFTFSVTCQNASEDCDNTFDDDGDGDVDCDDLDCAGEPGCSPVAEICDNVADDDGDGQADCDDSDCTDAANCQPVAEICDNVADDDGDGQADCDDSDCADAANCQPVAEICDNGADDDGDGQADCDDSDCADAANCQPVAEICDNGADDDGDGQADCDDSDCADAANCQPVAEICDNGADDDGDGQADCDDTDCAAAPNCQPVAESCDNGVDDDGDGQADCDDSDCANAASCQPVAEICDNNQDDDGDGHLDCLDSDCANDPGCQPGVEQCNNGLDDDGDGQVDCLDADCSSAPACQAGVEQCANGLDDDGDGQVDCDDADCAQAHNCLVPAEICNNGLDDDSDGQVDCDDTECTALSICQVHPENCYNGLDDDGDATVDCSDPDCLGSEYCVEEDGGGCGCAASASFQGSELSLLGLALGLVALARLRRR